MGMVRLDRSRADLPCLPGAQQIENDADQVKIQIHLISSQGAATFLRRLPASRLSSCPGEDADDAACNLLTLGPKSTPARTGDSFTSSISPAGSRSSGAVLAVSRNAVRPPTKGSCLCAGAFACRCACCR